MKIHLFEVVAQHPEHAGKLVNDERHYVRMEVAQHPEHAGELVNDENSSVQKIARLTLKKHGK